MSAPPLHAATWPPDPDLRQRRGLLRLLAGLTDELDALARGHALATRMLQRLGHLPGDTLVDSIGEIDRALVTPLDSTTLVDLARPHDDVHRLLRDGLRHRTDALARIRRLTAPPPFTPLTSVVDHDRVRPVLTDVLALLNQAGHALTRADTIVATELHTTAPQTVPDPDPTTRQRTAS